MTSFVALLRGINVGGNNLIAMSDVATSFRAAGFTKVSTYGQSGNVLFAADGVGIELENSIQDILQDRFGIPIPVLIRSHQELTATVAQAPTNHGSDQLRSDVFFLKLPLTAEAAFAGLPELREGVDSIAIGPGALYFSRVAALATTTRIQRLYAMPMFQQMTVRTWSVTTRLMKLLDT